MNSYLLLLKCKMHLFKAQIHFIDIDIIAYKYKDVNKYKSKKSKISQKILKYAGLICERMEVKMP